MFDDADIREVFDAESGVAQDEPTKAAQLEYGGWLPEGNQTRKIRRPKRDIPAWAGSDEALRIKVLGHAALKRLRIAHLYWRCEWNAQEISDELNISRAAVEQVIHRLKNLNLRSRKCTDPL